MWNVHLIPAAAAVGCVHRYTMSKQSGGGGGGGGLHSGIRGERGMGAASGSVRVAEGCLIVINASNPPTHQLRLTVINAQTPLRTNYASL